MMHRNQAQPQRTITSRQGRKPAPALRLVPGQRRPRRKLPGVKQQAHHDFVWAAAAGSGQLSLLSATQKCVPAKIAAQIRPRPSGQTRPLSAGERYKNYTKHLPADARFITSPQAQRIGKKQRRAARRAGK